MSYYYAYTAQARVIHEAVKNEYHSYYNGKKWHSDHRYSIYAGYKNYVPLEIISSKYNLRLISPRENIKKGKDCSISLDELLQNAQPSYKLKKFCSFVEQESDLQKLEHWRQQAIAHRQEIQKEFFKGRSRQRREKKRIDAALEEIDWESFTEGWKSKGV